MKRFANLVNETVNSGFARGINLFMENLEPDIQKNLFLENNGISNVVAKIFEDGSVNLNNNKKNIVDI